MPRVVDHDTRRAELARAVWALVARGGLEAVSLRSVAAEAGVSMGRVQYYFATKDDLLINGLSHAHRRMEARILDRLGAAAAADLDADELDEDTERAALVMILDELLGEHPETRDAIRVHAAFAGRAVEDERTAAVLTDGDDELLALTVAVVRRAVDAGRVAAGVDPEVDGYALWTLARGLGQDVALHGVPPDRARRALHRMIDLLAPAADPDGA